MQVLVQACCEAVSCKLTTGMGLRAVDDQLCVIRSPEKRKNWT